jgi:hypothetical protein
MNKSTWKALEYARDGMFVPEEHTKELISKIRGDNILVMFSFEMLPVLHAAGYKNVTCYFPDHKKYMKNFADKYGYKMIGNLENTKFDFAVGNPPYGTVHVKMMRELVAKGIAFTFVCPSNWLIDRRQQHTGISGKNDIRNEMGDSVRSVELFNGNGIFRIGEFSPLLIINYDPKYHGPCKVKYFDQREFEIDTVWDMPFHCDPVAHKMLLPYIEELKKIPHIGTLIEKTEDTNKSYLNFSTIRGHVADKTPEKYEPIHKDDFFSFLNYGCDKRGNKPTDVHCKFVDKNKVNLAFDSEKERDNVYDYLRTKMVRGLYSLLKRDVNTKPNYIDFIPVLDFTKDIDWLDEDAVAKELNMPDEIKEYFLNFIPDLYDHDKKGGDTNG